MSTPLLVVEDLAFGFPEREVFDSVSFTLLPGESMSVVGPSGSGKSTLLGCVVGLLTPSHGRVTVAGTDLSGLTTSRRADFRLRHIGMVFQFGELLPELTVVENVSLPLVLAGTPRSEARARAERTLDRLGLASRSRAMPETLSGGETQRAAVARALVTSPAVVVADEPTGMLDDTTSAAVMVELRRVVAESDSALLVVTHDRDLAATADLQARLHDGLLTFVGPQALAREGGARC